MQTTTVKTESTTTNTVSCTSPPCTISPCVSPINVTVLSDHSNTSSRLSPINKTNNVCKIETANLLNQSAVTALSSPLSASPTGSPLCNSSSSSPSSSLSSPITHDLLSSNEKLSAAKILIKHENQQLNATLKSLTQAKIKNSNFSKDEKNAKVSNFSIEAIMSRDVENQNIKSGLEWELCRSRQQLIDNLSGLYADYTKEDTSTKLAQLSQLYHQNSHLLGTNNELSSPNLKFPLNNQLNYQLTPTSPTSNNNQVNGTNSSFFFQNNKLNGFNRSSPNLPNNSNNKSNDSELILNCSNNSTSNQQNLNIQSVNNVSNNSSASSTQSSYSTKQNKNLQRPNPWAEKIKPKCNCPDLQKVECHLETKGLWSQFYDLGTEMIITKTGRRMFPTLKLSFTNLENHCIYLVAMDIIPMDDHRYRYAYHKSSWSVAGKADPPSQARLYLHPDAPFNGEQLRKQIVSFEKVKLTNNEMDKSGHIVLNSMHRYQPRIHLIMRRDPNTANLPITDLENENYRTFVFPKTVFTAVTAYQNQLITKLKIDSNPFAKGFRDSTRMSDAERETVENILQFHRGGQPMMPHFLFNGAEDRNATSNFLLREKAALLSIHGLSEQQAVAAVAAAAQQANNSNGQHQNQSQISSGQTLQPSCPQPNQPQSLVINNNFALQSNLLAASNTNPNALNNLNAMSSSNSMFAAAAAAAAAAAVCNNTSNSPSPSNKMLLRTNPADIYSILAALPYYSAALGNFKASSNNPLNSTPSLSLDQQQQMAALHQFWNNSNNVQNQLSNASLNALSIGNNSLAEHAGTLLNSGPIRPTIHSAESILQTMNRYTPYSYGKKELQGDCN